MALEGFRERLAAERGQRKESSAALSSAISEGLFNLSGGSLGQQSEATLEAIMQDKITGLRGQLIEGLKAGNDELGLLRDYSIGLQAAGDTEGAKQAMDMFDSLSTEARRVAIGEEFSIEQQRLKEVSTTKALQVEATRRAGAAAKAPDISTVAAGVDAGLVFAPNLEKSINEDGSLASDTTIGEETYRQATDYYEKLLIAGYTKKQISDALLAGLVETLRDDDFFFFDADEYTIDFDESKANEALGIKGDTSTSKRTE